MRARGGTASSSSRAHGSRSAGGSNKLLILLLSAGLVFAYVYLYNPGQGSAMRRKALSSIIHFGDRDAGGQVEQLEARPATAQGKAADTQDIAAAVKGAAIAKTPTAGGSGAAAAGGAGAGAVTHGSVTEADARHPNNADLVIAQGSSHDEHKADDKAPKASDGNAVAAGGAGAGTGAGTGSGTKLSAQQEQMLAALKAQKEEKAGGGGGGGAAGAGAAGAQAAGGAAAARGTPGATNEAKAAGGAVAGDAAAGAAGKGADGAVDGAAEHHELGSGVRSQAASLIHAAQHLKEAAQVLLRQQKPAMADKAAAAAGGSGKDGAAADAAAAGTAGAGGAGTTQGVAAAAGGEGDASAVAKAGAKDDAQPPPDLLAYSKAQGQPGDTIHMLFTSNGSPYQNIQARIMVGTFRLMQKMPGGEKFVAITRILHRQTPDPVMDEIPTFRADPLQPECDTWCWFPVADRANAVQQWIDAAHKDHSMVKAPWLLMLETDYVWVKPLTAMGSAYDPKVPGLAFKFDYMAPHNPIVKDILKMKCPTCDPKTVPGSGPAPVLMRFSDLRAATPLWEELSQWIETHEQAKKQLGWVREMYAWDIGVAVNQLNILTQPTGTTPLIAQPPHDHQLLNATMYHYTWGCIVKNQTDGEVWKFDKRFYTAADDALKLPVFAEPPPWVEGLHVHDGTPWTQNLRDTMLDMIQAMNRGAAILPNLLETKATAT